MKICIPWSPGRASHTIGSVARSGLKLRTHHPEPLTGDIFLASLKELPNLSDDIMRPVSLNAGLATGGVF